MKEDNSSVDQPNQNGIEKIRPPLRIDREGRAILEKVKQTMGVETDGDAISYWINCRTREDFVALIHYEGNSASLSEKIAKMCGSLAAATEALQNGILEKSLRQPERPDLCVTENARIHGFLRNCIDELREIQLELRQYAAKQGILSPAVLGELVLLARLCVELTEDPKVTLSEFRKTELSKGRAAILSVLKFKDFIHRPSESHDQSGRIV